MTTTRRPSAPTDLGTRGRAFWRSTVAEYQLSNVEAQLLAECCQLLDECDTLRGLVKRDGTTVAGSTGQPRVHPALGELRQHRLALGKLLAQLALPDETGEALATPLQSRASTAARARWDHHGRRPTGRGPAA